MKESLVSPRRQWRRSTANILSLISFYWVYDFIKIGQKRSLIEGDIDELPIKYKSKYLLNKFKLKWENELNKHKLTDSDENISLLSIVFGLFSPWSWLLIISLNVGYWSCMGANTIFLQLILKYLDGEEDITKESYFVCIGFAVILFLRPILEKAQNIRVALTAVIFEKSLKVSSNAYNTAQIINILSDDVQKFEMYLEYTTQTIASSVLLLCLIYFIYIMNNWYILLGLIVIFLLIPIFSITAPKAGKFKAEALIYMDKRLKLIKEAVVGYLNTKMYCWEPTICKLVEDTRKEEVKYLLKKGKISASIFSIMAVSDTLILSVIMLTYFYVEGVLLLSMVYPIFSLYINLKIFFLIHLPRCLELHFELKVSLKRIMTFLLLPELKLSNQIKKHNENEKSICIQNGLFFWPQTEQTAINEKEKKNENQQNKYDSLQSISVVTESSTASLSKIALTSVNLVAAGNNLIGVIGKVGNGKTSLLLSVINELELYDIADAKFEIHGKIGYCSQVPWIFNGSVGENILFGNKYDEEWYNKVIFACSLNKDLGELPHSDETIIGSRGINLSGGQKTRINLARCIYDKPTILLLDDILSSVDSIVSKHIFTNVLNNDTGLMNYTLRILVTHQINILPLMDRIIIMENNKIAYDDKYENLKQIQSVNINEVLHSHFAETKNKERANKIEQSLAVSTDEEEAKYVDATIPTKNMNKSSKNIYQLARCLDHKVLFKLKNRKLVQCHFQYIIMILGLYDIYSFSVGLLWSCKWDKFKLK